MPDGPLFMNQESISQALYREVVAKTTVQYKSAVLDSIGEAFRKVGDHRRTPFCVGIGPLNLFIFPLFPLTVTQCASPSPLSLRVSLSIFSPLFILLPHSSLSDFYPIALLLSPTLSSSLSLSLLTLLSPLSHCRKHRERCSRVQCRRLAREHHPRDR